MKPYAKTHRLIKTHKANTCSLCAKKPETSYSHERRNAITEINEQLDELNQPLENSMKFKDYVEKMNKLLKERPETAELEVVYAKDAAGNGFKRVLQGPDIGFFDGDDEFASELKSNAICIN